MKFTLDLTNRLKTRSDELQKFLDGLTRIKNKGRLDGVLVIRKQYDFEDKDLIKSHPYHIEIYNSWRE